MLRAALLVLLPGATWALQSGPPGAGGIEFFEKKIRPVLAERCYSCHSAQIARPKGSLRVDGREALLKGGDRGPSVVPGDPDKSLLVRAIRHAEDDLKMPPKGKLSEAEIADVSAWVKGGASWPSTSTSAHPAESKTSARHWSFELPKEATIPPVRQTGWIANPIDAFVLARLEKDGLAPSPPADRRTLLRRFTHDLLGLPPTPEEIDAFVADPSPDAWAKVVDRLLSSPRYGERWARHWLDVARYADTTDYDANGAVSGDVRLVQSALYRDWVIRAFNEDLPYDRFVTLQLAADQLVPEGDRADLAAMGFLTIGRRFAGNAQDIIDDRLDVIGRGTLGLTLSCARCHDHKFDPIPTKDYYSLYGVFQASKERTVALAAGQEPFASELKRRNDLLVSFKRERGEEFRQHLRSRFSEYVAAAGDGGQESPDLHPLLIRNLRDFLAKAGKKPPADAKNEELLEALKDFPPLSKAPEALEEYFDIAAGYEISYLKSKVARWEHAAPGAPSRAVILEDSPPKENPRVFKRGNPSNPGESVPRQFLEALCGAARQPFSRGSGRLELARAIATPENPLTARVIVNRIWLHHFGEGLVRTPSDFGLRSEPPSHPELLDWLALRFVRDGWSIKKLHRLILESATYRQSSRDVAAARRLDPENRLLWRMNPRRLDFEGMRDSLLTVADALDTTATGPAEILTCQPFSRRRSVYGFMDRLELSNLLLSFDVSNPAAHTPRRHSTLVPQQALFMMNSPFLLEQARRLAARPEVQAARALDGRIQALYRIVFGRRATSAEMALGRKFVEHAPPVARPDPPAWAYGTGEVDEPSGRVSSFRPLPCFTGRAWQCSPYLPDPDLGWIMLDATGGAPGDDPKHAAIRRWTAPRSGTIAIRGDARLLYDADVYQGCVRARIVSSRAGEVRSSRVGRGQVAMAADLAVQTGDTVDFIVDCPDRVAYSQFGWAPVLEMKGGGTWSAESDFAGPPEAPLAPLEAFAQVLLMSNEFFFLD